MLKSCSLGMETEKEGLALGGGLETTEPSFLGMPVCQTGSGASPKGREGWPLGDCPLLRALTLRAVHFLGYQLDWQRGWKPGLGEGVGKSQAKETPLPFYANQAGNNPAGPTAILCTGGETTVKSFFVDFIFPFGIYACFCLRSWNFRCRRDLFCNLIFENESRNFLKKCKPLKSAGKNGLSSGKSIFIFVFLGLYLII